jgi:ribosomal protein L19
MINLEVLSLKNKEIFAGYKINIRVNRPSELTVITNEVKITFLEYNFPTLGPKIEFGGISFFQYQR